jgi:hypothetical protein
MAIILIAGLAAVGASLAQQQGRFAHIEAQSSGDSTLVAEVNSKSLTLGDVRRPAEKHRAMDVDLTEADSRRKVIGFLIEERALQSEVERLDMVPTDEETQAYIQPDRDYCNGDGQSQCLQIIRAFGYDNADEY